MSKKNKLKKLPQEQEELSDGTVVNHGSGRLARYLPRRANAKFRGIYLASVSLFALIAGQDVAAGSCTETASGSGNWNCAGATAADVTQTPTPAAGGAVSVTSTSGFGLETATGNAISLVTAATDTNASITITDGTRVSGADAGIEILHSGSGDVVLTTNTPIAGDTDSGVYVISGQPFNSSGGDLRITTGDVTSQGGDAIEVTNNGFGSTSITSTGTLTSSASFGAGISVFGYATTDEMTIEANDISAFAGIEAINNGGGGLTVTTTGHIEAKNPGITANNFGQGASDLTITATDISAGAIWGIAGRNNTNGDVNITTNGDVTLTGTFGYPQPYTRRVPGPFFALGTGVSASVQGNGDIMINAHNVTGVTTGIIVGSYDYANNFTGPSTNVTITATGTVKATLGSAIRVPIASRPNSGGGQLYISVNNIDGAYRGIDAQNIGGNLTITATGDITSQNDYALYTETLTGGLSTLRLTPGASLSSASGKAIFNDAGDSDITIDGARISGSLALGDGSDKLTITSGADISGLTTVDGGDDAGLSDGYVDEILISDVSGAFSAGTRFSNWERIVLDNSTITSNQKNLAVGNLQPGTGLFLKNSTAFTAGSGLFLNSNLDIDPTSAFRAVSGRVTVGGAVANRGLVDLKNQSTRDVLMVNGDFNGPGVISFDTVLGGDASPTDVLIVNGDFNANAKVQVNDVGGQGAHAPRGIKLIDVNGAINGDATLLGNYVTENNQSALAKGAYTYKLVEARDGFRLVSELSPSAPVYEAYLTNLQSLNRTPSYRERRGAMRNGGSGAPANSLSFMPGIAPQTSPFWMRVSGGYRDMHANKSTTDSRGHIDQFMIDGGIDIPLAETANGILFGGALFNYGYASSKVKSGDGDGKVNTDGFGTGLTASWVTNSGFYVDGQVKYTWFSSDVKSDVLGTLTNNHHGHGVLASIEFGQQFNTVSGFSITPQMQLTYSDVDFKSFDGPFGERVKKDDGDLWELRTGIVIEKQVGDRPAEVIYGLANVYYTFDRSTKVDVSGVKLSNAPKTFSFEAGFGGQLSLAENAHLYGQVVGRSALKDDLSARGSIGIKWSF